MARHNATGTIPPGLRVSHDLNNALTTWSTGQRTVIGLAADFADCGEWMATGAASAAHWPAGDRTCFARPARVRSSLAERKGVSRSAPTDER